MKVSTTLLALATVAFPALAKHIRVEIPAGVCRFKPTCEPGPESVILPIGADGGPGGATITFNVQALAPDPNQPPPPDADKRRAITCHFGGRTDAEEVVFQVRNSASYLSPCDENQGLRMYCTEPYPTCQ